MKKYSILFFIFFIVLLCGCEKKEHTCSLDKEYDGGMKISTEITLYSKEDIIERESVKMQYIFKDNESLEKYYKTIEEILKQDDSLKIEQSDKKIIVRGEKDVTEMKYDKKSKIAYYEQLGYTCK